MPNLTCADCGRAMMLNPKSRPQGLARCHPCRRQGGKDCPDCGKRMGKFGARCYACDRKDRGAKAGVDAFRPGVVCIVHYPRCTICERPFTARLSNQHLCSIECRTDFSGVRKNELYATAVQLGRVRGRMWYEILVAHLRERDGDACGICGEQIDMSLKGGVMGDDDGRTIDHIWPKSQGGSDELFNLRLTHWRCNRSRKDARTEVLTEIALF